MTIIPVYGKAGVEVDRITIGDDLEFLGGRVSKGRRLYYKGAGTRYSAHFVAPFAKLPADCSLVERSDVFYMGPRVCREVWKNRFGIFRDTYQPQFTDLIGTCGVKELAIFEHSDAFERSSVEYVRAVRHDEERGQYYFELIYHCGRQKYLDGNGDPLKLRALLDYMLARNWCFVWDKTSIEDVSHDGRVSDVADLFQSRELSAAFGSVYSILYSLYVLSQTAYADFLQANGLRFTGPFGVVFSAVEILRAAGRDVAELTPHADPRRNYWHMIGNYLATGRNCGHCCNVGLGEQIAAHYAASASRAALVDLSTPRSLT